MRKRLAAFIVVISIVTMGFLMSGIRCREDSQTVEIAANVAPGEIVFQTDAANGIFRFDTDTFKVTQLGERSFNGYSLAVSPSDQNIVGITSDDNTGTTITQLGLSSSLERSLVPKGREYKIPAYTRDGASILFVDKSSEAPTAAGAASEFLYSISAVGGVPVKGHPAGFQNTIMIEPLNDPVQAVVVAGTVNSRSDAYLLNIDGKETSIQLTSFGSVSHARVSPNGSTLVVANHLGGTETYDLYVCRFEARANLIGAQAKPIISNLKNVEQVFWSRDGTGIIVVVHPSNRSPQIWKMKADGSGNRLVAGKELFRDPLKWKP